MPSPESAIAEGVTAIISVNAITDAKIIGNEGFNFTIINDGKLYLKNMHIFYILQHMITEKMSDM